MINKKEYMTYDDYVFDYTTGKWISSSEMEEFDEAHALDMALNEMIEERITTGSLELWDEPFENFDYHEKF